MNECQCTPEMPEQTSIQSDCEELLRETLENLLPLYRRPRLVVSKASAFCVSQAAPRVIAA